MKKENSSKTKLGIETEKERKKRVAQEKKETEYKQLYFQKIKAKTKVKINNYTQIDVFKFLIWKESIEYFFLRGKKFEVDDYNKNFLNLMSLYFSNNSEFQEITDGSLKKGLWITGSCGTGKSSMFDIIQIISQKYNLPHLHFKNITVNSVITDYNMQGEQVVKKYTRGKVHFDDLGTEKLANSWGVKEELMKRIIEIM